jgi:phosphoglycolate phosphatase-like HAD superfamily hydrolase
VADSPSRDGSRPTIVVFDIDGVIADVRHRLRFVEQKPKDWDSFFAAMDDDGPLETGIALARERAAEGHRIVYLTGRNEDYRGLTRDWLARHGLPEGRLVMRRADDRRPARLFKPAALRRIATDGDVVAVVDDDDAVVAVLSRDGWPVLHATWMAPDGVTQQSLFDAQEVDGRT